MYNIAVDMHVCITKLMDFEKFWKVMETDDAIFQDLENFGNGRFYEMAMEKYRLLFGEIQ